MDKRIQWSRRLFPCYDYCTEISVFEYSMKIDRHVTPSATAYCRLTYKCHQQSNVPNIRTHSNIVSKLSITCMCKTKRFGKK